jgi:hypothetical protein
MERGAMDLIFAGSFADSVDINIPILNARAGKFSPNL